MTYTPNVPQSGQTLGNTRQPILDNFTLIGTGFAENHEALGSVNAGKHTYVEMPNQATIPAGLVANEGTLYVKVANGRSQLFYTNENSGNEYQLTRTNNGDFSLFATNTNYQVAAGVKPSVTGGWTFLPGGMLLQYGIATDADLNANYQIDFPKAFSTFVGSITITPIRNNTSDKTISVSTGSISLTGFDLKLSSNNLPTGATWMAIGV